MRGEATPAPLAIPGQSDAQSAPAMRSTTPLYVGAIVAAEIVLSFFSTQWGLVGHAILIAALLNHYLLASWRSSRASVDQQAPAHAARALPALALVPLLRLLSLVMPLSVTPVWFWYLLAGMPFLLATLLTARALHYSWSDLGLSRAHWATQLAIALSGPLLGLLLYTLTPVDSPNLLTVRGGQFNPLGAIAALLFAGCAEELLFRGLLRRATGGITSGTILFGTMYLATFSLSMVLFMTLVGLFFGWCAARTNALWGVALANGLLAASALVIYPLYLGGALLSAPLG